MGEIKVKFIIITVSALLLSACQYEPQGAGVRYYEGGPDMAVPWHCPIYDLSMPARPEVD